MRKPVDLYDSHYSKSSARVYGAVRVDTFGEDLGQTSWITAAECDDTSRWLGLGAGKRLLEIGCGTGGVSIRIAERTGASVVGMDINDAAVAAALERASAAGLRHRAEFRAGDADDTLPFPGDSFDALFCNDAINHFRDRQRLLADWYRVLRPGGRCLYTDPVVVTGCLSNAEIAARSSIGFFLFTPPGVNEALLRAVGFRVVDTVDVTQSVATISSRWHDARLKHEAALLEIEGETRFTEFQDFLAAVHTLASEHRLSRYCYLGEKESR